MNNNVKIAKELVKLAKSLVAGEEKSYEIGDDKVILTIPEKGWKDFGKSPEWLEIVDCFDDSCKGNFYGIDRSCSRVMRDRSEIVELTFDGANDAEHKSPKTKIEQALKSLGFKKA